MDAAGTEFRSGHVVIDDAVVAVGDGPAPAFEGAARIDASGLLVTPGFVNSHHHLYQWITRGYATDDTLFDWLTTLYPVWARLTPELVHDSAAANLGWMALTGCTTSTDHHYVFPSGAGDLLEAEIRAAAEIGLRFHPTRGSMNLGAVGSGGLPPRRGGRGRMTPSWPPRVTAIDRWHDDVVRLHAADRGGPLLAVLGHRRADAGLRRAGSRAGGPVAHPPGRDAGRGGVLPGQTYGRTPAEYAEELGWLGSDVWLAHCVHLSDAAVARFAEPPAPGVAHCPTSNGRLGSGIAPMRRRCWPPARRSGWEVDGAASNESGRMVDELHQSLLAARFRGGPLALTARQSLQLATIGGARCLGRQDRELGSLEVGKLADLALWRVDGP